MYYEPSHEPGFADSLSWPADSVQRTSNTLAETYNHYGIHEEILKDKIRTRAFKQAILRNKYLFQNKIVLDLGCGTGHLSFFASRAGASQIYAIDNSNIIESAEKIAKKNNLKNITFIKGKVEEIVLPVKSVDIIISDCIGYFLLFENKLSSVITARNKWLVPGGLIFPDKAKLYISAIEDAKYKDEKFEFWNDIYGIDMSIMRKISLGEGQNEEVACESILSTSCPVFEVDLTRAEKADLEFISSYEIQFTRNDFMHGIMSWFEVFFSYCHKPLSISTSPRSKLTRWKQTVFYLDHSQPVGIGQIMQGSIAVKKSFKDEQGLDIKISFNISDTQYPLNTFQYYSIIS